MVVVRIMFKVKAELQSQFALVMRDNIQKSREFAGCQTLDIFSQPHKADNFLLYQEWASQETFEAFHNSDYFKESSETIFPLLDGTPDAAYYQAKPL